MPFTLRGMALKADTFCFVVPMKPRPLRQWLYCVSCMMPWTCDGMSNLDAKFDQAGAIRLVAAACTAFVLGFSALPSCADEGMAPEVAAIIALVVIAHETIDRELVALLPPASVSEELLRLRRLDQEPRLAYGKIDFTALPADVAKAAHDAVRVITESRDAANLARLKQLMPAEGWFTRSEYGDEAAQSAWLIVHHAINSETQFMKDVLARMERLLSGGDINTQDYAYLYDRVAMHDGRRQRYGTQFVCRDRAWTLYPVEEEGDIEARRREIGIKTTVAEQFALIDQRGCAGNFPGPWPK